MLHIFTHISPLMHCPLPHCPRCHMVPHCPLLHFPPLPHRAELSTPTNSAFPFLPRSRNSGIAIHRPVDILGDAVEDSESWLQYFQNCCQYKGFKDAKALACTRQVKVYFLTPWPSHDHGAGQSQPLSLSCRKTSCSSIVRAVRVLATVATRRGKCYNKNHSTYCVGVSWLPLKVLSVLIPIPLKSKLYPYTWWLRRHNEQNYYSNL